MYLLNLREQPDAIPMIARWHFDEWHALFPYKNLQDFADDLRQSLQPGTIPQSWLLLADPAEHTEPAGSPLIVGTASLLAHDMTNNQQLSPWLANIYIHPDWRGRGLGQQIVRHVMTQARALGLTTLYLFTEDQQAFYEKLGWQLHHRELYEGEWVSVMTCAL